MHGTIPEIRRNVMEARAIVEYNVGNAQIVVSDIRRDVRKARTVVEHNIGSAHAMVSDIHRTVNGQEGGDGKDLLVSDTRSLAITE